MEEIAVSWPERLATCCTKVSHKIENFVIDIPIPVEVGSIDQIFQPCNSSLVVCRFNFDRNTENVRERIRYPQSNCIRHCLIVELVDNFFVREHHAGGSPNGKWKERGQVCRNVSKKIYTSDISGRRDNLRSQVVWQFSQREKAVYCHEIRLMKRKQKNQLLLKENGTIGTDLYMIVFHKEGK